MTALKDFLQTSIPPAPPTPQQPGFFSKVGNIAKNIGNAIIQPFAKVAGSGVRALEAIPPTVGAGVNLLEGNKQGAAENLQKSNQIQQQPMFGQPTLAGSTPLQNLGTAAQVGSFAVGGELGPVAQGALIGTAQGAGNYAANSTNPNLKGLALSTGVGAATGGVVGAASQYVPEALQAMRGGKIAAATTARDTAAEGVVEASNKMAENVLGDQSEMGQKFTQGSQKIKATTPDSGISLSSQQLESLNNLKESAKFSLPDNLDQTGGNVTIKGSNFQPENPKILAQLKGIQNEAVTKLDPVQTQDLIRRLNKLTFASKASGELAVNQQTIGLTNEIKDMASKAFGPEWDKLYSDYHLGKQTLESIDDIVNINPNATASELEKSANNIKKLSESPTGKIFLKQKALAYEKQFGTNLNDHISAMQKLLDAENALTKAKQPGLLEKVFSPTYLGRSAVRYAVIYGGLKSLQNALQGK